MTTLPPEQAPTALPPRVILSGIGYRVAAHEGAVIFTEDCPMWGHGHKLVFTRPEGCWYVEFCHQYGNRTMVGHITAAMRWIEKVYGGNHTPIGKGAP